MAKVFNIAISENYKGKMESVVKAQAVAGKGLVNDRHYKENNSNKCQITLIEVENINYYNKISGTSFLPKDFRRNIITEDIKLNQLVGKEFYIGKVKVKAHDLCRPCKYLQESLNQNNIIKELILKGGLRCEILTGGNILIGDKLKY